MLTFLKSILKKRKPLRSFEFLHTDIHSHLIPGIDDGAPDVVTSVALIKGLRNLGFKKLITTPHIMADLYPNTPAIIREGLDKVRTALEAENVDIEIDAAAEYLLDEGFAEKLEAGNLLTLNENLLLVEMSFISPPPNLEQLLFNLQTKGYRPIMAHPERYGYYNGDLSQYKRLKERGCLLQLNLLSLSGYYGPAVRRTAIKMLKAGLFDLVGTDLHHERHLKMLQELLLDSRVGELICGGNWLNKIFNLSSEKQA
ncbi:tyrosine-protein phosphatase [Flavilitoribacter nigricans]|uniref:tyrosine-protein phosphatase n=1 Tax=Flavilitoribacter nigricans TaxID=70997 RepID=UPI00162384E8|nr:CpsB/CapC family capsule biosynthesis tyrosine phosphatase [Flavilitoribacter nigricans]